MKPGNDLHVAGLRLSAWCGLVCENFCDLALAALRLLTPCTSRVNATTNSGQHDNSEAKFE
jgi:hypothetical protein